MEQQLLLGPVELLATWAVWSAAAGDE